MPTTQIATPDAALQPFVHRYVEGVSKVGEVIEPMFPRSGTMLILQFASINDGEGIRYGRTSPFLGGNRDWAYCCAQNATNPVRPRH